MIEGLSSEDNEILQKHDRYLDKHPDLLELFEKINLVATKDGLTEVYNRRYFDGAIRKYFDKAKECDVPISLVILDIDHFKSLNDRNGHPYGDKILKQVAEKVKGACRPYDRVCRYGGEEIAVILPFTDMKNARNVAERIRENIYQEKVDGHMDLSVSCGVASFPSEGIEDYQNLIDSADSMTYKAKHNGRNKTYPLP